MLCYIVNTLKQMYEWIYVGSGENRIINTPGIEEYLFNVYSANVFNTIYSNDCNGSVEDNLSNRHASC